MASSAFISDYEKTGLLYVDMVASCVSHYRRHWQAMEKPLKTIYLSPKGFMQFSDWSRKHMSEEQASAEVQQFTFDGVEVKENSYLMGEKIYFDFYEPKTNGNT